LLNLWLTSVVTFLSCCCWHFCFLARLLLHRRMLLLEQSGRSATASSWNWSKTCCQGKGVICYAGVEKGRRCFCFLFPKNKLLLRLFYWCYEFLLLQRRMIMRGVLLQAAATALVFFFFLLPWSFNQPRIPIIEQKLEQNSRKFLLWEKKKKNSS